MVQTPVVGWRRKLLVGLLLSAILVTYTGQRHGADAQATGVTGFAYGFFARVGLFGGPAGDNGPLPIVMLPAGGGEETDSVSGGVAQYGPASIYGSDEMVVSTEGTTGPGASVTSSVSITNIDNEGAGGPFNAGAATSTCTATEGELAGSATFTDAIVETKLDPIEGTPTVVEDVAPNPAPNTEYTGTLDHVGDNFRIVLNEQVVEGETITVRAAHVYLLGPIAVGELIIGESVCGIGASGAAPPGDGGGSEPDETTTTGSGETTTTESGETTTTIGEADDEGGGSGGTALLIGAVMVGGGLLVALLLRLRRSGGGAPSGG